MASSPPTQTLRSALLVLLLGPILWAMHLSVIYFSHAVLCMRGVSPRASEIVITVATVAAVLAMGWHLLHTRSRLRRRCDTDTRRFQYHTGSVLSVLSMIGILWAAFTPIFVQACAAAR
jgi:hypothetical protein